MLHLLLVPMLLASMGSAAADVPFRLRLTADPQTLDWNLARTSYETHIIMNLMEGLVEEGPDLKPVPALAESWQITPDGKTYTFQLRSNVLWSDGRKLRAQDFVDSWIRLLDPKTRSTYASHLYDLENAEAFNRGKLRDSGQVGVKALGEDRLQVKLRRPVPHFLHLPTFWVTFPIRLDLIRKLGKSWTDPGKLVTLGPYLLSSWKKGDRIQLVRNSKYFGPAPQVATVEALVVADDAKARTLFQAGDIDILLDATTRDLIQFSKQVGQYPYLSTYYLGFRLDQGVLKDVRVRKALALALEREKIPSILQGGQVAATGWIPPGMEGHRNDTSLVGTLFDARGLMSQAGFAEGRGFPKQALWVARFDGADRLAVHVRQTLREKLGIEIETNTQAAPEEFQRAVQSGKASLFIKHWGADYPDAANFLEVFESGAGSNGTGWKNTEYDALLERARVTLDGQARAEVLAQAEKLLLQRECVIVPVFYKRNTALLGSHIEKFEISPLNYLFFKNVRMK